MEGDRVIPKPARTNQHNTPARKGLLYISPLPCAQSPCHPDHQPSPMNLEEDYNITVAKQPRYNSQLPANARVRSKQCPAILRGASRDLWDQQELLGPRFQLRQCLSILTLDSRSTRRRLKSPTLSIADVLDPIHATSLPKRYSSLLCSWLTHLQCTPGAFSQSRKRSMWLATVEMIPKPQPQTQGLPRNCRHTCRGPMPYISLSGRLSQLRACTQNQRWHSSRNPQGAH